MAIQNLDYLVVGDILGANHLGLYLLAWNISSFPVNLCVGAIGHLSVAAFAQLQDERAALHRAFEGSITAVTAVMLPLAVLMAVLSAPAVRTVYGTKWSESAGPLAFLALLGTLRVAAALVTDVLFAIARGRAMLVLQATWLVALIPALVLGARLHRISGVGMAHLGVFVVVTVPAHLFVLRSIGFPSWSLLRAALRPAVGALGAAVACAWVVRLGWPTSPPSRFGETAERTVGGPYSQSCALLIGSGYGERHVRTARSGKGETRLRSLVGEYPPDKPVAKPGGAKRGSDGAVVPGRRAVPRPPWKGCNFGHGAAGQKLFLRPSVSGVRKSARGD